MPNYLPDGSVILTRDIPKLIAGEAYKIIPEGQTRQVEMPAIDIHEFNRCRQFYSRFKLFGLPHGKGWINEPEGAIFLLETFQRYDNLYEQWEMDKVS